MSSRIVCTHFRNVSGTPRNFREVFVDEGQVDMIRAMETVCAAHAAVQH
jgi:D-mannonate dehydratase